MLLLVFVLEALHQVSQVLKGFVPFLCFEGDVVTHLAELGAFFRQFVVLGVDGFRHVIGKIFMAHGRRIYAYNLGARG